MGVCLSMQNWWNDMKEDQHFQRFIARDGDIIFDAPADDKAAKAIAQPPAATLDYWRDYDGLMEQLDDAWLNSYMTTVFQAVWPIVLNTQTATDIDSALDAAHPDFEAALLGTDDAPGPLVKLIMAGMGAGQEAIYHGSAANPQRPVSAKALEIDWTLLAREARDYARQYVYDLIRNVDATTRQQVQQAVTQWIESGQSLDELKKSLQAIFNDPARARLIAQTETTRAFAAGSQERYRRADVKFVKWYSVRDGSVCPICKDLVGTTAPIDEGFKTAKGTVFPPAHPSCRCYIRPVLED